MEFNIITILQISYVILFNNAFHACLTPTTNEHYHKHTFLLFISKLYLYVANTLFYCGCLKSD